MSSSFSLQKRRQVFVLDFVQSVLSQYDKMVEGGRVPKKSRDCIARINNRRERIMNMTVMVPAVGLMSKKRQNQYMRIVGRSRQVLDKHFAGENVDGSAMMNAIMTLVEDIYFSTPASRKKTKKEWDMLRGSLATLYRHHDPEMDSPWQEKGLDVCKDMHMAIEDRLPYGYPGTPNVRIVGRAS